MPEVGKIRNIRAELDKITANVNKIELGEHPFHKVLQGAVEALNNTSAAMQRTDDLTNLFVKGQASIEDVMLAEQRSSLMMNLTITVVNNTVNTFKEIQQMPL